MSATTTTDYAPHIAAVRARMRQAVEDSGLDLDTIAKRIGIPLDELRDDVLNGTGTLYVVDVWRVGEQGLGLDVDVWAHWMDLLDA
jgi:hypothetical protein